MSSDESANNIVEINEELQNEISFEQLLSAVNRFSESCAKLAEEICIFTKQIRERSGDVLNGKCDRNDHSLED